MHYKHSDTCGDVALWDSWTHAPRVHHIKQQSAYAVVLFLWTNEASHSPGSFYLLWCLSRFLCIIQTAFLTSDSYSIIDLWPALSK